MMISIDLASKIFICSQGDLQVSDLWVCHTIHLTVYIYHSLHNLNEV